MSDSKKLGPAGEEFAWNMLKKRGDKLVARNFTCPVGELDLITWHGTTLVFTEVRARSGTSFGSPAETVTKSKQQKIKRTALWFGAKMFKEKPLPDCRFDMIWLIACDGKITQSGILEGAFF